MLEQSAYPAHTQPEELSFCEFTAASPSPLCALHTLASGLVSRPGLLQDHVTLSRALGEVTVTDGWGALLPRGRIQRCRGDREARPGASLPGSERRPCSRDDQLRELDLESLSITDCEILDKLLKARSSWSFSLLICEM